MSNNPFNSPTPASAPKSEPYQNIKPAKPAAIMVFGIINFVFAAMGLCGSVFAVGLMVFFTNSPELAGVEQDLTFKLLKTNTVYAAFTYGNLLFGFVMSLVLGVAGFGLIKAKSYGRKLSIYYCLFSFLSLFVGLVVNAVYIYPQLVADLSGPNSTTAIFSIIGSAVGILIGIAYPSILLFFMTRKNVIEAVD